MDMTEKTVASREVFSGRVMRVFLDEVELPDGRHAAREILRHNGGVCCAVLNSRDEIAFVRQYRYVYGRVVTELPAGKLEPGEAPDDAVKREVREETGAEGTEWRSMGELYPTPGYCGEIIHLYACRLAEMGETQPDDDEFLETLWVPFDEAVQMVMRGELPDSKTQVLILKLAQERCGK